jgi:hypothetical protein
MLFLITIFMITFLKEIRLKLNEIRNIKEVLEYVTQE